MATLQDDHEGRLPALEQPSSEHHPEEPAIDHSRVWESAPSFAFSEHVPHGVGLDQATLSHTSNDDANEDGAAIDPEATLEPDQEPNLDSDLEAIHITGTVQGVGFRPFVYRLALACGLTGTAANDGGGVIVWLRGPALARDRFVERLWQEAPPLARIAAVQRQPLAMEALAAFPDRGFAIRPSQTTAQVVRADLPPDAATCADCLRDVYDPFSRFYRYPFTTCTHCGPRASVVTALPYDRSRTTMAGFKLCPACTQNYGDPENRRFHAQAIACPTCGPRLRLVVASEDWSKDLWALSRPALSLPQPSPATTMGQVVEAIGKQQRVERERTLALEIATEMARAIALRSTEEGLDQTSAPASPQARPAGDRSLIPTALPNQTAEGELTPAQRGTIPFRVVQNLFGEIRDDEAIEGAADLLEQGAIVAIKGLGGFHLACDATNRVTVHRLRQRKQRPTKPLAVMMPDLATIERWCDLEPVARTWLTSAAAPIVLLPLRSDILADEPGAIVSRAIAMELTGGLPWLGVMLPSTPLHHLLLNNLGTPIVLTSANSSGEPPCLDNDEAIHRLAGVADAWLLHNRPIHKRFDDAVVRIGRVDQTDRPEPVLTTDPAPASSASTTDVPTTDGKSAAEDEGSAARTPVVMILRRAKGYAPTPIALPPGLATGPPILACGGDLKAVYGLSRDGRVILSTHLGDLSSIATRQAWCNHLDEDRSLYDHRPLAIAVDSHPDGFASRQGRDLARTWDLPLIPVQHHHAHAAACLADNAWPASAGPVLAVVFDGAGWGEDGTVWGGEFLWADYTQADRLAALRPVALPGGDRAAIEPWRNAYAQLRAAGLSPGKPGLACLQTLACWRDQPLAAIEQMIQRGSYSPLASSVGRLFDAVAAVLDVAPARLTYEGQAAIALEAVANPEVSRSSFSSSPGYPWAIRSTQTSPVAADLDPGGSQRSTTLPLAWLDPQPMWLALVADLAAGRSVGHVAARFHQGLAEAIAAMVLNLNERRSGQISTVALTGGVFQNALLLAATQSQLVQAGLQVLIHRAVPANDGGLALGQAAIATARSLAGSGSIAS